MKNDIHISFICDGVTYSGRLSHVHGAGSSDTWHLYDDRNFYCGRLRKAQGKWVFDPTPKTEHFAKMAEVFGMYIEEQ